MMYKYLGKAVEVAGKTLYKLSDEYTMKFVLEVGTGVGGYLVTEKIKEKIKKNKEEKEMRVIKIED